MKFAVGFVLYNPEKDEIKKINNWIKKSNFDVFLIYDNSPNRQLSVDDGKTVYFFNGVNDGLAVAYNVFISYCKKECIDYLCIMDQDSEYPLSEVDNMIAFIESKQKTISELPIIAPRSYCVSSVRVKREEKLSDAKYVINSGTFLSIFVLKKMNLAYDENIFLDGVDYDFCMLLHKRGLPVKIYENSILIQNLGYTRKVRGKNYVCHSELRYYYIVKARNYSNVKYYGKIKGTIVNLVKIFGTIYYICIVEDYKKKKITAALKGFFGLKSR